MTDLINELRQQLAELQGHLSAHQKQLAEVTRQLDAEREAVAALGRSFDAMRADRDSEREARKALAVALKTYNEIFFGDDQADAALALAAKLP